MTHNHPRRLPAPTGASNASSRRRQLLVLGYVAIVAILAIIASSTIIAVEISGPPRSVNWLVFGLFAVLLLVGESQTTSWLRFGDGGEVTPAWAFAFAMLLLGSPTGAIVAMAVATLIADLMTYKDPAKIVFNVAQVSLALALGGHVLHEFGIDRPLTADGRISLAWGFGMILSGAVVFLSNGLLTCAVLALHRGISIVSMLREGFALSITADGALLAMAPIFVIAIEFSLLLLPLLGVTTFLVYHSARQAMQRAHEANHDALTKLLNRRAFADHLEAYLGAGHGGAVQPSALLLIDLDGFKEINDRLGHQTGDGLLQGLAERMERIIPVGSIAARLGGDEFAILLAGFPSKIDVRAWAQQIRGRLSETVNVDGFPLSVGMSVGIAFAPEHGSTAAELMSCADIAMYRAKRYRTGVEAYESAGRTSREHGRLGLLGDLTAAIERNELAIHYQPQVRLADGGVEAVEALLRWNHPTLGPIPPGEFVALAEHTDLIGPLTAVVLERAAIDTVSLDRPALGVAVNISARNLQDRHFPPLVLETIERTGLAPHRLDLEITESAIASEPERCWFAIETLREAGVRITIDDFGTGYSSFLGLRDLRVDRLKVDRAFIAEVNDGGKNYVIVRSILSLARELGLQTVAEGVEDEATWETLRSLRCDLAQGFLVARSLPLDVLRAWLIERERTPAPLRAAELVTGLVEVLS